MGDGKRSFADLAALTGECESLLDQLVLDGMIEPVGSAAAAGADAAPGPTPRE